MATATRRGGDLGGRGLRLTQVAAHHHDAGVSGETSAATTAASPKPKRSLRCRVERLILGSIMGVIAAVLDRRLRRVFAKR